jgi:hypothetical protein
MTSGLAQVFIRQHTGNQSVWFIAFVNRARFVLVRVVYMYDLLHALVAPQTCLNTTEAVRTAAFLGVVDPAQSPWWSTWVKFQVQYYDMPRNPGDRIESPATLGRKCWAFAYLRQVWISGSGGGLKHSLQAKAAAHALDLNKFVAAWDAAVALTMPLCDRVMANCFLNDSYSVGRNGTCPELVDQFIVGYVFENEGGGRNDSTGAAAAIGGDANNARADVPYPFPMYMSVEAFERKYAVVKSSMATLFNYIM